MTARASRLVSEGASRHRALTMSAVLNKKTSRGATITACAPAQALPRIAISPRREVSNAEAPPTAQSDCEGSLPSPLGLELIHGSAIKSHGKLHWVNNLQNSNRR